MANNHLNENEISQYIDFINNEVEDIDKDIINHIEDCFECKHKIITLYDFIKDSENSENNNKMHINFASNKVATHKSFKSYSMPSRIAAILVFALVSGIVLYIISNHIFLNNHINNNNIAFNNTKELDYYNPSNKNVTTKEDNSSMYVKSSYLENFIESGYRSANIKILSPKSNQNFTKTQNLVFKINETIKEDITLEILNNTEKKLYSNKIEKELVISNDNTFPEGLYYYKFTTENDLLCVGKFTIK